MDEAARPRKSLGQHWLDDRYTLEHIAGLAELNPRDTVLEIGPGTGSLTEILLPQVNELIAVELDAKLAADLERRFAAVKKLKVMTEDIRRFNLTTLPAGYKVIANIPYYLTSYLIRLLSESSNSPAMCVLLVQKEVAQRLAARPGQLSLLAVTAQAYWDIALDAVVPAGMFRPAPKVDSQIVVLRRHEHPLIPPPIKKQFVQIVSIGFAQKRKTIANCLASGLRIDKETANVYLDRAGIDPMTRPQQLSIEQWIKLTLTLFPKGS